VFNADADWHMKQFNEGVVKFTDSLIASTSSEGEQIMVWEPKTLAPYEPIFENKFIPGANTLNVNSSNFVWACHAHKSIMNVWRWDKKEPLMRFPLREQLTCFKTAGHEFCAGGDKKGHLTLWAMESGEVLSDMESAHYMEISDLDLNGDMIITGGKDCKVKVWLISDLLSNDPLKQMCFAEFNEHTSEVTQVKFCSANTLRAFSASTDKQFKVYDIASKMCVKTILTQSSITKVIMDHSESNIYVACDNQNIYCYGLETINSVDPNQAMRSR